MDSSQLLILGNGFDVHCGLKSSYKDFFRNAILDATGESFGLYQLRAGVKGFWEGVFLEYYKVNHEYEYNWCKIEEIIKDILWLIYYGEETESASLKNGLWLEALSYINDGRDVIDDKIYQDRPILRYVFVCIVKFFERLKFTWGTGKEKLHLLSNQLLQELKGLEKRFCKYLKNQIANSNVATLNVNYIINAVNLLARLTGFAHYKFDKLDDIITVEEKKYLIDVFENLSETYILSFNYTAIFDFLEVNKPCVYNNVHGKLCANHCAKDCKTSSVIFGIDDNVIQSQSNNSELRLFSKTYRKMFINEDPIILLPPKDNKQLRIKFYGHSLSEADYSYFQSIFDYYDLYGNTNVSLIFYYSKGYEQQDAIYSLISEYGRSFTNKEQGKNLIHKLLLENRLQIIEIKD